MVFKNIEKVYMKGGVERLYMRRPPVGSKTWRLIKYHKYCKYLSTIQFNNPKKHTASWKGNRNKHHHQRSCVAIRVPLASPLLRHLHSKSNVSPKQKSNVICYR